VAFAFAARHITEDWKTGRRASFDKRLGRSVENDRFHNRLLAPGDLFWVFAKRTRFEERSCLVRHRHSRRYCWSGVHPREEDLKSWTLQRNLPGCRPGEGWDQLCWCQSLRFCPACLQIGRDVRSAAQHLVLVTSGFYSHPSFASNCVQNRAF
jgi:hypothetical protein